MHAISPTVLDAAHPLALRKSRRPACRRQLATQLGHVLNGCTRPDNSDSREHHRGGRTSTRGSGACDAYVASSSPLNNPLVEASGDENEQREPSDHRQRSRAPVGSVLVRLADHVLDRRQSE